MAKKLAKKAKAKAKKPVAKPIERKRLTKPAAKPKNTKKPTKANKKTQREIAASMKKVDELRRRKATSGKPIPQKEWEKVMPAVREAEAKKPKASKSKKGLPKSITSIPGLYDGSATGRTPSSPKEQPMPGSPAAVIDRLLEGTTPGGINEWDFAPIEHRLVDQMNGRYALELVDHDGATKRVPASLQQCGLFDWIENGIGNAFVEAVAGSGKTTSLTQGCRFMRGTIALTAFNKKIAVDIQNKLSRLGMSNQVEAGTFHSFGFKAIRRAAGDNKIKVDGKAKYEQMFEFLRPPGEQEFPPKLRSITSRLIALAKQRGCYLFWQPEEQAHWQSIIEHHSLDDEFENPAMVEQAIEFAKVGIRWHREVARSLIDFDDMIWIPVITKEMRVYQFDWVLVDEAQDTNPARRALAHRMMKPGGRIIFVGDRHQAIYGFTGADNDAVDLLIKDFKCLQLPLTVTYRCPQAVVREAQKHVKHIVAWEKSDIGSVESLSRTEFWESKGLPISKQSGWESLTPADAILCRNTKPVVSLAFQLIRRGKACHVEGRDIGQGLIKLCQRWKVTECGDLHDKLEDYLEKEVEKLEAAKKEGQAEALRDKVETLFILMEGCADVKQVIAKIEELFADTEDGQKRTITLSTVHKAKGREWDRVFILGAEKYMPSKYARKAWELEQETNIIYVAVTRAMKKLVYVAHLEEIEKKAA